MDRTKDPQRIISLSSEATLLESATASRDTRLNLISRLWQKKKKLFFPSLEDNDNYITRTSSRSSVPPADDLSVSLKTSSRTSSFILRAVRSVDSALDGAAVRGRRPLSTPPPAGESDGAGPLRLPPGATQTEEA